MRPRRDALKTILVATDLSDSGQPAVQHALALAGVFNASLRVLHVVSEPLHEPWSGFVPAKCFVETVERLQSEARHQLEALVPHDDRIVVAAVWGDASDQILKYARSHHVDLVVCGTHGRRGWNRVVMGSVAERVLRLAPCPVLTVPAAPIIAAACEAA
jgi:nucleotide-binding universal stress UspA family protein